MLLSNFQYCYFVKTLRRPKRFYIRPGINLFIKSPKPFSIVRAEVAWTFLEAAQPLLPRTSFNHLYADGGGFDVQSLYPGRDIWREKFVKRIDEMREKVKKKSRTKKQARRYKCFRLRVKEQLEDEIEKNYQ